MAEGARWWESLADDFYLHANDTAIDAEHRLKIWGTAGVDRVLRTGLGTMIVGAMGPGLLAPGGRARQRALMRDYAVYADRANPDEVFQRPPRGVSVRSEPASWLGFAPKNIPHRNLSFASPFQPLHPTMQRRYGRQRRNVLARAQYWYHPDGPRPTLMLLHGYWASAYAFNSWFFSLPWFYRKGYDVLLCTQPFHSARAERWHPWSGYGYFAGGMAQVNEAMLQAICDLRVWLDYLEERGAPRVGVSGYSLGGYLTAILAAVEQRLAFAIPNSPVVNVFDMAMEWQPVRPLLRSLMWLDNLHIRELRHGMALHSPLTYPLKMDPKRLLIISGAGDRFTSPRFVRQLHDHWPGSQMHWFPGNHLMHLRRREYLRLMKNFMDRCCVSTEENPTCP